MDKDLFRATSLFLVIFLSFSFFIIIHETLHATFCENYGGKASFGTANFTVYTQCEIENTENRDKLKFLNNLNEMVGYYLGVVLLMLFAFMVRGEFMKLNEAYR